jgi:hypothetical protein
LVGSDTGYIERIFGDMQEKRNVGKGNVEERREEIVGDVMSKQASEGWIHYSEKDRDKQRTTEGRRCFVT